MQNICLIKLFTLLQLFALNYKLSAGHSSHINKRGYTQQVDNPLIKLWAVKIPFLFIEFIWCIS